MDTAFITEHKFFEQIDRSVYFVSLESFEALQVLIRVFCGTFLWPLNVWLARGSSLFRLGMQLLLLQYEWQRVVWVYFQGWQRRCISRVLDTCVHVRCSWFFIVIVVIVYERCSRVHSHRRESLVVLIPGGHLDEWLSWFHMHVLSHFR